MMAIFTLITFLVVAVWWFIKHRASRPERKAQLLAQRELPICIDSIALALKAGVSFDMALELYCSARETELARQLISALRSWQLGLKTRNQALADVAHRLNLPDLNHISKQISEAMIYGAPIADVLAREAKELKAKHRDEVEARIEKAPVKMLIPTGVLILPAMLLAILGPLMVAASTQFS